MNEELNALQRKLEIRKRELAEAHSHIAALEEKLLKLKQYRRELKLLKEAERCTAQIRRAAVGSNTSRALSPFGNGGKENFSSEKGIKRSSRGDRISEVV